MNTNAAQVEDRLTRACSFTVGDFLDLSREGRVALLQFALGDVPVSRQAVQAVLIAANCFGDFIEDLDELDELGLDPAVRDRVRDELIFGS
jgi:hypothetical protein